MKPLRIGMLTPSSNTVLEPVTGMILAGVDGVTAHYSRFRVTEISMEERSLRQFDDGPMLAAAELLADARVDVICWNGTSAAWLGLDADRALCARITEATGIPACTSMLTLFDVLHRRNEGRVGLVTPYVDAIQHKIVATFKREGVDVVAEEHLGISDNLSFANVDADTLSRMVGNVAAAGPDAIAVICTNLAAAPLVDAWETLYDIPAYDTVATAVYGALVAIGKSPATVSGFGRLFR